MSQIDQTPAILRFKQVRGITWLYNFQLVDASTNLPINLSTYNITAVIQSEGSILHTLYKNSGVTLSADNLGFTLKKDWVSISNTGVFTPAINTLVLGTYNVMIYVSSADGVDISPICIEIEIVEGATEDLTEDASLNIFQIKVNNGFTVSVNTLDLYVIAQANASNLKLYTKILVASSKQDVNGGVSNTANETITIPIAQTGVNTYLMKTFNKSTMGVATGDKITFVGILKESQAGTAETKLKFACNKYTTTNEQNIQQNVQIKRLDTTTLQYSFDIIVGASDITYSPFWQVTSGSTQNNSGSDFVFTSVGMYYLNNSSVFLPSSLTYLLDKIVKNELDITSQVTKEANDVAALTATISSNNNARIAETQSLKLNEYYDKFVEAGNPAAANGEFFAGATALNTNAISIPIGSTGALSYRAFSVNNYSTFYKNVGKVLKVFALVEVTNPSTLWYIGGQIARNGITNASTITNRKYTSVGNNLYIAEGEMVIDAADETATLFKIFVQIGASNPASTSASTITLRSFGITLAENAIGYIFQETKKMIEANSTDLKSYATDLKLYTKILVASSKQDVNGGIANTANETVTIPVGQTGINTFLLKTFNKNSIGVATGDKITFVGILKESQAGTAETKMKFACNKNTGVNVSNIQQNVQTKRINATTLQYSFEITIEENDITYSPFWQVTGGSTQNNSGSDFVFTSVGMYYLNNSSVFLPSSLTYLLDKIVKNELEITSQVTKEANDVVALTATISSNNNARIAETQSLKLNEYYDKFVEAGNPAAANGEFFAGATALNTNAISIPIGSTGALSYRAFSVNNYSTFYKNVGKVLKVFALVEITNPSTLWYIGGQITRNGITNGSVITNRKYTPVGNNLYIAEGEMVIDAADETATLFKIFVQIGASNPASTSASTITLRSFGITLAENAIGYIKSFLESKILESGLSKQVIIKTVKPDGTGDYLSPKLANDAIVDASEKKQYTVIVYPGIYTEVEWVLKDYITLQGTIEEECILKGEMPNSATDSQISLTSTIWLKRNSKIKNITVTAKNMRYPVHSEDSGTNKDCIHTLENCTIDHLGNSEAVSWRTANPNSGLSPSAVWGSQTSWGYGSASGLKEYFDNVKFRGNNNGWYVHTNKDFTSPNENRFSNCSFLRKWGFGDVIQAQALGSGVSDILDFKGCTFSPGYISVSDSPWISVLPENQVANKAQFAIGISGSSKIGYRDNTRGKALRITSNQTDNSSNVAVSGNAIPILFGSIFKKEGGSGLKTSVWSKWDISGILVGINSNIITNNTIGRRLGDCTTENKILTVVLDNTVEINIVFNQDYTSQSNTAILTYMNSLLGSVATADEFNPAKELVYPNIYDRQEIIKNSSSSGIERFSALCYNSDKTNIRLMQANDPISSFAGIALDRILPNAFGRILKSGYMDNNQLGIGSFNFNSNIFFADNGKFSLAGTNVAMKGIAQNWAEF